MILQPFESSCRHCHPIRRDDDDSGVTVLVLPTGEEDIETWLVEEAEDALPPFMRFLLMDVPRGSEVQELASSLMKLFEDEELDDVLMDAVERLLSDLREPEAFAKRLMRIRGRFEAADEDSFSSLATELENILRIRNAKDLPRIKEEQSVPLGSWTITATKIEYRPTSHRDTFVQAVLDLGAGCKDSVDDDHCQPTLRDAFLEYTSPSAPGRCFLCHGRATGAFEWVSSKKEDARNQWTSFSHSPHVSVAAECESCHAKNLCYTGKTAFQGMYAVDSTDASGISELVTGDRCEGNHWNFAPIQKDKCVSCHGGDSSARGCLECHSYHVGAQRIMGRTVLRPLSLANTPAAAVRAVP